MIGVVVVTHGQLATELVNAAEMIVGDLPQFTAVSIGWHDDVNDAREEIAQAVERVRGEEGVLLLTDMFGGTPSNIGMTFLETDRLEVITGVNLPMLIKLASLRRSSDLLAVAKEMRDHGRSAIWVASDLLRGEKSSMGILLLAAARGSTITISGDGSDERDAVAALVALVQSGFGEDACSA
jgi:PTS system mannose-specific IIA component